MYLLQTLTLFRFIDVVAFPLVLLLSWVIILRELRSVPNEYRKYLKVAFVAKVLLTVCYILLIAFYYEGGDTFRYFYSILDARRALADGAVTIPELLTTDQLDPSGQLSYYYYTSPYPDMRPYMMHPHNFVISRLGALVSFVAFQSYMGIGLLFSLFSLLGCWRLFRVFVYYYPEMHRQIALATLFIPSLLFWSAGIMKDPIAVGGTGFMIFGVFNIFIRGKNILSSIIMVIVCGYLVFAVKAYVFLVFAPATLIWVFMAKNASIPNPQLRKVTVFFVFLIAGVAAFPLVNYFSSLEYTQQYQLENLTQSMEYNRNVWEKIEGSSSFKILTDNPVLLFLSGWFTAYFRPFPWEVQNPVMILSALECLACLHLMVYAFRKVGFFRTFYLIFKHPLLLFCFIITVVFGVAVGTTTGNFGSLVRYKIPGFPFFLFTFLIPLYLENKPIPSWMQRLLPNKKKKVVLRRKVVPSVTT